MDKTLPHSPGVYLLRDVAGRLLYIGKARDLARRVSSYYHPHGLSPKVAAMISGVRHVDYLPTVSEREALILEQKLIRQLQPPFNSLWRDDKSYPYIKLTLNEDFPRLYLTRRVLKDGARYYGPYPNAGQVRRLLRYLWKKKFFPLRPCKFEFSEGRLPPYAKVASCLYLHTQECPAPCVGKISKDDYRKIAEKADLFFRGRYGPLLQAWETEMKQASRAMDYERAAQLRDNIATLRHMGEEVTFKRLREEDLAVRQDRARAMTELQQALSLPQPPLRIEAFDISHFQGLEPVASLVVFERGQPQKSDYRRFKIKTVIGIDDFASLAEVVKRRYQRVLNEGQKLPDLILIDGGKGQLSAAKKALAQVLSPPPLRGKGATVIPIAALAKQEEALYVPEKESPILLPGDSPALHLVQHVRDEAHRFAVAFHRLRRKKRLIK